VVTAYPELDAVLAEITVRAREALGGSFVGAYVEGSFALGAGDLASDVDVFVVVDGPVTDGAREGLAALHRELPARDGFWNKHVEGSYPPLADLRDPQAMGRPWLFVDHGDDTLAPAPHGNDPVHRWVLRERGLTLAGPPPASFVAPVSAEDLRGEMRRELPELRGLLDAWLNYDIAWCQRYLVINFCRELFTLVTGTVDSKRAALDWARDALDPRWRPLLDQVIADRAAFDPAESPRPGSVAAAFEFAAYATDWAAARL
jgi:hypothetical protein